MGLPGAVGVEAAVGDAVVFNIRTYHSAWGDGTAHRRGLYINFQQRPTTDDARAYMHKLYARDGKDLGVPGMGGKNMYYPSLFDATASAQRLSMTRYLKEKYYDHQPVQPWAPRVGGWGQGRRLVEGDPEVVKLPPLGHAKM